MNQAARNLLQELCNIHICAHCNKIQTVADPLVCSCCETTVYCGQACQQQDWNAHLCLVGGREDGDTDEDDNPAPSKKSKAEAKYPIAELSSDLLEIIFNQLNLQELNLIKQSNLENRNIWNAWAKVSLKKFYWKLPATEAEFKTMLKKFKDVGSTIFYKIILNKPRDSTWLRNANKWHTIVNLIVNHDTRYDELDLSGLDACENLRFEQRLAAARLKLDRVPRLTTLGFGPQIHSVAGLNVAPLTMLKELRIEHNLDPTPLDLTANVNLETLVGCNAIRGLRNCLRLTKLHFGPHYNDPAFNEELQFLTRLTSLKFGKSFDRTFNVENQAGLLELICGYDFDQVITGFERLPRLIQLEFNGHYNRAIINLDGLISLEELRFESETLFNQPLIGLDRLTNLKLLSLGPVFNQPLQLPLSILVIECYAHQSQLLQPYRNRPGLRVRRKRLPPGYVL